MEGRKEGKMNGKTVRGDINVGLQGWVVSGFSDSPRKNRIISREVG
jgi:hypothetical protein